MILLWLVAGASADPVTALPAPAAAEEEITVWGDAVDQAKDAVVSEIEGLGYGKIRKRDDRTVFLAEEGWKGKVVFYDDGRLATKRRGFAGKKLAPIGGTRIRPYPLCLISPFSCVDAGSWYLSASKWRHNEDAVARETAAELVTLGDRIADASVAQSLAELPDRLERSWTDGVPLEGTTALPTYPARRAALLAFWDSRTRDDVGRAGARRRGRVRSGRGPERGRGVLGGGEGGVRRGAAVGAAVPLDGGVTGGRLWRALVPVRGDAQSRRGCRRVSRRRWKRPTRHVRAGRSASP